MSADWRWVAAVIDGEGHISVVERRRSTATARRIAITNCSLPLLVAVARIAGGKIHTHTPPKGTNKQQFQWYVYGADMDRVLQLTVPYLVSKRDEALLALAFSKTIRRTNRKRLTADERAARVGLLEELKRCRAHQWGAEDVPPAFRPTSRTQGGT